MTKWEPLIAVLAAAGNLLVFWLAATRRRRAPGRRPLMLLCLALALWNLGRFIGDDARFGTLSVAAVLPALMLHFVLRFLDREARHRAVLRTLWAISLAFFAVTLGGWGVESLRRFVDAPAWNGCYLLILLPFALWAMWMLFDAHRAEPRPDRRRVIRYVLIAAAFGLGTGVSDLFRFLHADWPEFGSIGSFACMALLCYAILRHHLLEIRVAARRLAVVLVLAALPPLALYWLVDAATAPAVAGVAAATFVALGLSGWAISWWQEQAEQRRRLAEMGEVSALLAHEIRNPLAAIKGAAQYLQGEIESETAREYVELVLREIDRLDAAVGDVQYFVRPVHVDGAPADLGALVERVAAAQRPGLPAGVTLRTQTSPAQVRVDEGLITQVLVNLVRNAVEAVGETGTVTIETRGTVVAVRDTGPGISDEAFERIFQPYFTTKTRGMGLGLALSRKIAEAHGGTLDAENLEAGGAEFRLELPASRE
ncbi:MAG: hypothetical protein A3F84_15995 [Candidatus Handelsmanbacteria bacterium RIFCSPLOWO2_12_FULL_64_10]|uniref:histidine kinase n=1 Tax=Handelsmanbacteria sp. (strain RIFCSPLOWO2_12_FULL_64_10) TaxID=1817868 RepID=A0A1F6CLE4_HANXR|nr:MAG: hypothetical protein A3F84_15995 [Candidatus Handelsmanbacteria bacterium RIFCSPLOWO2_12_FULL_64_10]